MTSQELAGIIRNGTTGMAPSGRTKIGDAVLKPHIAQALQKQGLEADVEDSRAFMMSGLVAWRNTEDEEMPKRAGKLRPDIVVYRGGKVCGLVEIESDLNDVKENRINKRNGHYDVLSIARNAREDYFYSYKSLERMAVAVFGESMRQAGQIVTPEQVIARLQTIKSDSDKDHNPLGLGIVLVTGYCRQKDLDILEERRQSIGAIILPLKII